MNEHCNLKTECTPYEWLYWGLLILTPVIIASVAIARYSLEWTAYYLITAFFMQIIIFRFLCTHCPHYCKEGKLLRCMFLWNVPKIFRPRPGAWKSIDKIMLSFAGGVTILFPGYWLWKDKLLLVLYILTGLIFVITLKKFECGRCTYFDCMSNSVPEAMRKQFIDK
jgi:hypothetical protein